MKSALQTEQAAGIITSDDVILVAVAHPDDETVFHAEYIRRAVAAYAKVHIAYATMGEASTINSRFWHPGFVRKNGREKEIQKATRRMDISQDAVHLGHLPDGKLQNHLDELTAWLAELIKANDITKVLTAGPKGYDKHPDHIAVDTAVLQAKNKIGKPITVLRLDAKGNGRVVLQVNTFHKLRATLSHFSQFPGFCIFGHIFLFKRTKKYLKKYRALAYEKETYTTGHTV